MRKDMEAARHRASNKGQVCQRASPPSNKTSFSIKGFLSLPDRAHFTPSRLNEEVSDLEFISSSSLWAVAARHPKACSSTSIKSVG